MFDLPELKKCDLKDKWETPDWLYNGLNEIYKFTLDPCCETHTAKCNKYYTEEENGLTKNWKGEIVFVNPPYSKGNLDIWMKKCYEEYLTNKTLIVALLPGDTSTKWFHNYVNNKSTIEYIKGRIKFKGAKSVARFNSIIVIYK